MLAAAETPISGELDDRSEAGAPPSGVADGMPGLRLAEVKVFSATKRKDREKLDEVATEWLRAHGDFDHVSAKVNQSSDLEYHCLSITFLCWKKA